MSNNTKVNNFNQLITAVKRILDKFSLINNNLSVATLKTTEVTGLSYDGKTPYDNFINLGRDNGNYIELFTRGSKTVRAAWQLYHTGGTTAYTMMETTSASGATPLSVWHIADCWGQPTGFKMHISFKHVPKITIETDRVSTKVRSNLIVAEYTDNTAALAAGLIVGDVYRTGDLLKIVH